MFDDDHIIKKTKEYRLRSYLATDFFFLIYRCQGNSVFLVGYDTVF